MKSYGHYDCNATNRSHLVSFSTRYYTHDEAYTYHMALSSLSLALDSSKCCQSQTSADFMTGYWSQPVIATSNCRAYGISDVRWMCEHRQGGVFLRGSADMAHYVP